MNYRDKYVLVTGGGGSIGSELCKQLAKEGAIVTALCHSEISLYNLRRRLGDRIHYALGDVLDDRLMSALVRQNRIVIHAAALKHVPLCEEFPLLAIATNVFGSIGLMRMCRETQRDFALISTDKAVRPASIMGATKRVAELFVRGHMPGNALTVRFGNVLDSAGSVLPLWREQIEKGGPLTLTHPECTRYFMSIADAVGLVLQAYEYHTASEVADSGLYMLDMGAPVRMGQVAWDLMQAMKKQVPIKVTGLRAGEKITEELNSGGTVVDTTVPRLKTIDEDDGPPPYLLPDIIAMEHCVRKGDREGAIERLWEIVR